MRHRKAFTLVELLVVIAIIAILIAILLPVCITIRNRAQVLVCPIAYVGEDGGVYLTDPKGYHAVQISESGTITIPQHDRRSPLTWSPCGRRLSYYSFNRLTTVQSTCFQEPSSGRAWRLARVLVSGWIDSETFLGDDRNIYKIYNGNVPVDSVKIRDEDPFYYTLSLNPIGADFPYVASFQESDGGTHIGWVRKDFRPGRVIWKSRDLPHAVYVYPKIDPFSEYVAWGLSGTFVKQLRQDQNVRPVEIDGTFCDWTEDGNVLTLSGTGTLAIYTKEGKLVRKLAPPVKPRTPLQMAAYRKYGHR